MSAPRPGAVEVTVFELNPGVSDDDFLRHAAEASAALKQSGGFIQRLLSRDGDGQWVDIVEWRAVEDAERAETAGADIRIKVFRAAIAPGAVSLRRQLTPDSVRY